MGIETVAFILMGLLAVALAGTLATRRFPVSAAMLLITLMVLLAGMYGLLDAHFAAVAQIIVYAGAIMVVFVFVMMLLNLPPEETRFGTLTLGEGVLTLAGLGAAVVLGTKVGHGFLRSAFQPTNARAPFFPEPENLKNVAALMFTDYLWAFELISFLILAAIIGAVVISKKRKTHAEHA
ncbi:MAG: NADH-quinone oxidoreductase subunit J [Silvanigrellales bacterium]|jgi:NADH-quinone oxidoreductase subunit J|nr:NADH-quinone oxidoreductase subunit J [Silvanigrellales bacterium]